MEEDNPGTLFTRLRKLGQYVDSNLASLKEDFSQPPWSAPQFYDRGLNILKKNVKDMKEEHQAVKKVQGSVQNFTNWLESMQELVDKQAEDLSKVEKYLMKFGFVPTEKPAGLLSPESSCQEKAEDTHTSGNDDLESGDDNCKSESKAETDAIPPSSCKKIQAHQGKNLVASTLKSKMTKTALTKIDYQRTPVSSKISSVKKTGLSTSYNDSYGGHSVAIEQWLQGVENCDVEVTPDVIRIRRIPLREKQEMREAANKMNTNDCSSAASLVTEDKGTESDEVIIKEPKVSKTPVVNTLSTDKSTIINAGTPVEPELSEYTTQLLSLRSFVAAKEKGPSHVSESETRCSKSSNSDANTKFMQGRGAKELHKLTKPDLYLEGHKVDTQSCTPEEPTLSYQVSQLTTETPEEPVLSNLVKSYRTTTEVETRTPEEPVLSYHPEPVQAKPKETRTPEEPVLSGLMMNHSTAPNLSTGTPEEPLLSYQVPQSRPTNIVDDRTPEEPVLSAYASAMHNSSNSNTQHKTCSDMPLSPELSDITKSFLSLRNCSSGVDRTSKAKEYSYIKSNRTESHYAYESKRPQLPYERSVTYNRQEREVSTKFSQENIHQYSMEQREKKNWSRPGVKAEEFLGVNVGDIPPSPQLSETTQRLFSWK